ncbi:MAG: aminotransferase class V-fold PLP-dependent enzyme [Candidatus Marinimicrobia bacterium]|nr:aminotransferase class V-fold PLP-dependent enzyme [Candidatus Neomarinimicrobiota bacterium]
MTALNTSFVRKQFTAFSEPALKDWGFFENAGGSYMCKQVLNRLTSYYTQMKVQPYHAYPIAQKAGEAMDSSYVRLAEYLNVREDEVHLGPSTSQNTYVLAHAFQGLWQAGDEIIVTNQDHEANSGVWRNLEKSGLIVREWGVNPETGMLDPEQLETLLSNKTRMVAYPHCSNIVAHWNPVKEINRKIHAAGAFSIVDGVAAAPHGFPDITELGADIYLLSLYKTWGPHLGLMTVKQSLMDQLSNQSHFFHVDLRRKKLLPAGPDHAQIAAASGVIEYLDTIYDHHFDVSTHAQDRRRAVNKLFTEHENRLLKILLDWLRGRDDVRILGPDQSDQRAPTVSIWPLRKKIRDVHTVLTDHKLMVGSAHFYAPRLLQAMNIPPEEGVLRMSFLHYTSEAEINRLILGLSAALD